MIEQKLQQLQQAYAAEILTRAEYERKRKAVLASARTPLLSAAVNEARALSILADISALMTAAAPSERRAVVGALFDKVWIQEKGVVAITPRADVGPVLAGLSQVRYGCLVWGARRVSATASKHAQDAHGAVCLACRYIA